MSSKQLRSSFEYECIINLYLIHRKLSVFYGNNVYKMRNIKTDNKKIKKNSHSFSSSQH